MSRIFFRRALPALLAAALAPVSFAQRTIADLAPESTVAVLSVDDASALRRSYERSSLQGLLDLPNARTVLSRVAREAYFLPAGYALSAAELARFEWQGFPDVEGALGLAVFPYTDEEGERRAGLLMVAHEDPGGDAERALFTQLTDLLEALEREDLVEIVYTDHAGAEIMDIDDARLRRAVEELDAARAEQAGLAGNALLDALSGAREAGRGLALGDDDAGDRMYITKVGDAVLCSSHLPTLRDAIDRVEGQGAGRAFTETDSFTALRRSAGDGAGAWLGVDTRRFFDIMEDEFERDGEDAQNFLGVFEPLGIRDVERVTLALRMATDDAAAETTARFSVRERRGIFEVIDGQPRSTDLPAFVGAEAASVSAMRFDFERAFALAREVMRGFAGEGNEGAAQQAQFDMIAQQLLPLVQSLGTEVTSVQWHERPYSIESERSFVAVELRDQGAVRQALSMFGAQMGATPREFLGFEIWESPFAPLGVGLTDRVMFIGATPAVEAGLRNLAQADLPKLAAQEGYQRAARTITREPVLFGYYETESLLRYLAWFGENYERIVDEQLREFADQGMWGEEELEDYRQFMLEQKPAWLDNPVPPDDLLRKIGDIVFDGRFEDGGFVLRVKALSP